MRLSGVDVDVGHDRPLQGAGLTKAGDGITAPIKRPVHYDEAPSFDTG